LNIHLTHDAIINFIYSKNATKLKIFYAATNQIRKAGIFFAFKINLFLFMTMKNYHLPQKSYFYFMHKNSKE